MRTYGNLTLYQILLPRWAGKWGGGGRERERKKTGMNAGSVHHHHHHPLRRNKWGNSKDRPHVKNQNNSHRWRYGGRKARGGAAEPPLHERRGANADRKSCTKTKHKKIK